MTTMTTNNLTVIVIMTTFPCTAATDNATQVLITGSNRKERWIKLRSSQRGQRHLGYTVSLDNKLTTC